MLILSVWLSTAGESEEEEEGSRSVKLKAKQFDFSDDGEDGDGEGEEGEFPVFVLVYVLVSHHIPDAVDRVRGPEHTRLCTAGSSTFALSVGCG